MAGRPAGRKAGMTTLFTWTIGKYLTSQVTRAGPIAEAKMQSSGPAI